MIEALITDHVNFPTVGAVLFAALTVDRSSQQRVKFDRFELLGDAVLNLITTDLLLKQHPLFDQGQITVCRSMLVSYRDLATWAQGCTALTNLVSASATSTVKSLADLVKALIGAVYNDKGLSVASELVDEIIGDRVRSLDGASSLDQFDTKGALQTYVWGIWKGEPIRYECESTQGADHSPTFTMAVFIRGERLGCGTGPSKKDAEKIAAKQALELLQQRMGGNSSLPVESDGPDQRGNNANMLQSVGVTLGHVKRRKATGEEGAGSSSGSEQRTAVDEASVQMQIASRSEPPAGSKPSSAGPEPVVIARRSVPAPNAGFGSTRATADSSSSPAVEISLTGSDGAVAERTTIGGQLVTASADLQAAAPPREPSSVRATSSFSSAMATVSIDTDSSVTSETNEAAQMVVAPLPVSSTLPSLVIPSGDPTPVAVLDTDSKAMADGSTSTASGQEANPRQSVSPSTAPSLPWGRSAAGASAHLGVAATVPISSLCPDPDTNSSMRYAETVAESRPGGETMSQFHPLISAHLAGPGSFAWSNNLPWSFWQGVPSFAAVGVPSNQLLHMPTHAPFGQPQIPSIPMRNSLEGGGETVTDDGVYESDATTEDGSKPPANHKRKNKSNGSGQHAAHGSHHPQQPKKQRLAHDGGKGQPNRSGPQPHHPSASASRSTQGNQNPPQVKQKPPQPQLPSSTPAGGPSAAKQQKKQLIKQQQHQQKRQETRQKQKKNKQKKGDKVNQAARGQPIEKDQTEGTKITTNYREAGSRRSGEEQPRPKQTGHAAPHGSSDSVSNERDHGSQPVASRSGATEVQSSQSRTTPGGDIPSAS